MQFKKADFLRAKDQGSKFLSPGQCLKSSNTWPHFEPHFHNIKEIKLKTLRSHRNHLEKTQSYLEFDDAVQAQETSPYIMQ